MGCLALLAVVLAGCLGMPTPVADEGSKAGRHFVQWEAFIGLAEGEDVEIQLSYVDLGPDRVPAITDVELQTDRGPLATGVGPPSLGTGGLGIRLATLPLVIPGQPVGTINFDAVSVTTEDGRVSTYPVGTWTIEVVAREDEAPFDPRDLSLGAEPIGQIEAELGNGSARSARITGLEARLPERGVTFMMYEGNPGNPMHSVSIDPGDVRRVGFIPSATSPEPVFVAVKPFLLYQLGNDRAERRWPFPVTQVWRVSFASEAELRAYLEALPGVGG